MQISDIRLKDLQCLRIASRRGRRRARGVGSGIDRVAALDVGEDLLDDGRGLDAGDDVQGCTNSAERMDARER